MEIKPAPFKEVPFSPFSHSLMAYKGFLTGLQYITIIALDCKPSIYMSQKIVLDNFIIMLLLQIYCVCDLTMMQCIAAEGVLGVKILISKL